MYEWSSHQHLVEMYSSMRCTPAELYPSEERFLPQLARTHRQVLDTGCAAGGFLNIWRHFNPDIEYLGVELSDPLVEAARQLHPGERFLQGNVATGLPLPDRVTDLVAALGWLNWEPVYREALRELWRLCQKTLFFDVRLDPRREIHGQQQLEVGLVTPYVVVAYRPFLAFLREELQPHSLAAYGYWGPPADTVRGVNQEVCFATFVLTREAGTESLELPAEFLE